MRDTGIPYDIIGPTLMFDAGDLLLNDMAWALRWFAIFPVLGCGDYSVQPVYAKDAATQAVDAGSPTDSLAAEAAGTEMFTFEELLRLLASGERACARLVQNRRPWASP